MNKFLCNNATALKQGGIRAFFDKAKAYPNVINLGIGEPDFTTPDEIIEAAYEAMKEGKTHYTANAGIIELRREISDYLKKYDVTICPDKEVIVTCGGMGALAMALLCSICPGDEVLIQDPYWVNYVSQVRFMGGVPISVPVYEEDDFSLKAKEIEKYITPKTKILIINSPNNPTGAVMSKEDLEEVAKIAIRYDLLVISDEVYCELLYDGIKHQSIASIEGMKDRTVIVNSLSKTFAMTGWRVGFAAGPAEFISKMIILQENLVSSTSSISQYAAIKAINSMCGVNEMLNIYQKRRNIMVEGLNSIKNITCAMPKGAFYVFPNIKATGLSSNEFANGLLDSEGVVTIPGSSFGLSGEGYLRISYANSESNIIKSVEKIKHFVEG